MGTRGGVVPPQKGADPAAVARLAARLERLAETMARDPRGVPLTGAAGGLAGGLWGHLDVQLIRGAPYVLYAAGFEQRAQAASAVLTGEGRLDATTREGKLVAEVALRAGRLGVPVHAIVGSDAMTREQRADLGVRSVHEAETLPEIAAAANAARAPALTRTRCTACRPLLRSYPVRRDRSAIRGW